MRIRCILLNRIAFLYIRPNEAINYSEAAHYVDARLKKLYQECRTITESTSVGWLEAVHHCSLKTKKRKRIFVELIGRFTCLNPMNHVTRSQRSKTFSPNLHGQGLCDPRWSYAIKQMIALLALSGSTCLQLILFINWSITRLLKVTRLYRCWQQLYLKLPQLNWNSWSITLNWLHLTSASFTYGLFISNYKDILYGIWFCIWHKKSQWY